MSPGNHLFGRSAEFIMLYFGPDGKLDRTAEVETMQSSSVAAPKPNGQASLMTQAHALESGATLPDVIKALGEPATDVDMGAQGRLIGFSRDGAMVTLRFDASGRLIRTGSPEAVSPLGDSGSGPEDGPSLMARAQALELGTTLAEVVKALGTPISDIDMGASGRVLSFSRGGTIVTLRFDPQGRLVR
jgi:hypothetical protein